MGEINIKDFLIYLRKNLVVVVLMILVFLTGSMIYDTKVKVPVYESSTTVVLTQENDNTNNTITQNDITINQKLVTTYSEIIKSKLVLTQVIDNLGLNYSVEKLSSNVKVEAVSGTEILKIKVTDKNAKKTSKIANEIALVFSNEVSKIYQMNNISIIDKAQVPKKVANDTLLRDLVISVILGIISGSGILFLVFYFDDTIKNSSNLEEELGMPVIAKIFKNDLKKESLHTDLILHEYPKALSSESIKSLRTNLQFSSVDGNLKTILVTSSMPSEGKSFISSNLALAFVQTGKKVLIIDCDMRKGRQHRIFNVSNTNGLSNLLISDIKRYNEYIKETKYKNLYLLTRGTCPPNPCELLNSNKNKELINILKKEFDLIIFDGVPCNVLTDSVIISTFVDSVLVVGAEKITSKAVISNTKKMLDNVNAPITGFILNKVNKKESKYTKYYEYYGDEK